jgi:hypothetical protein
MKKALIVLSLVTSSFAFAGTPTPSLNPTPREDDVVVAQERARVWLELLDSGKYEATWDTAGELFQKRTPKERWTQQLGKAREVLGKAKVRELVAVKLAETLPGAPKGKYVVLQYKTSYTNQLTLLEAVTPALGTDGTWRVAGYSVYGGKK